VGGKQKQHTKNLWKRADVAAIERRGHRRSAFPALSEAKGFRPFFVAHDKERTRREPKDITQLENCSIIRRIEKIKERIATTSHGCRALIAINEVWTYL